MSIMTISIVIYLGNAEANDFDGSREIPDYSYRAARERQEERNRQIELQRYQQREYLEQQQQIYQQDMYNQVYQRNPKVDYQH